jgi:hypothetical protein
MPRTPRPTLLAIGIVLASLRTLLMMGVMALVGAGGMVMMLASTGERGDEAVALLVFGAVVLLLAACLFIFEFAVLALCIGAWLGWRPCVWALLAVAVLGIGLPSPGPFKTPIAIVTLIGCIQALERPASD